MLSSDFLPHALAAISQSAWDVNELFQLLADTSSCRQNTLFCGTRAASLDQVASDHKKKTEQRAAIIQKLTLSTQSEISTSLFSSRLISAVPDHTTGFPVTFLFALQGIHENTNFLWKMKEKQDHNPTPLLQSLTHTHCCTQADFLIRYLWVSNICGSMGKARCPALLWAHRVWCLGCCEVGVETGISSGQQLQAGAMASRKTGPHGAATLLLGRTWALDAPGAAARQGLGADGLLVEGPACRGEGLSCSNVHAERGGGVCMYLAISAFQQISGKNSTGNE